MSWCKAVVDEVQTGKASYVGGSTAVVPSTSVSTASQANAYNQPASVSYSSSGAHVMSHYPQQQPIPAWQYPQQPTVYSQHPGALQYLQQPSASVCTNRQPAAVLQYPQQPPAAQHAQQPAAQPQPYYKQPTAPQSLQVPNAAQYCKQSSVLQYPYQSTAVQSPVYQATRYYEANVPTERPMATYASVKCLNPTVTPTFSYPNYHDTYRW